VKPELRRFGNSQSPVVVIDDFGGSAEDIARLADALAPFTRAANYYPGLRRILTPADRPAYGYAERTCEQSAPFIAGAFDIEEFTLLEASFSMVTVLPGELMLAQRAPHFDSADQNYFALLHYLRVPPNSGTAFYRQRSTGIERVTDDNLAQFVSNAKADSAKLPRDAGYIHGTNPFFEQIGAVEAIPDRMIIYQGSLLHSGIIPEDMSFSTDPRRGRLTANIFVRGH
jgi:hypothetical protein